MDTLNSRATDAVWIAYLIHTFPLYSTTFVTNEIDEMRRRGVALKLFSIREPAETEYPPVYRRFHDETHYLFSIGIREIVSRQLKACLGNPRAYLRVLGKAAIIGKMSLRNRVRTLFHFFEAVSIHPELQSSGVRHIHVHFLSGSASVALFLHEMYGIRYTMTAHGTDIFVEKVLLAEKMAGALFTRVGTEHNRKYLRALLPPESDPDAVVAIPFGIDQDKIAPRAESKAPGAGFRILNVGRLIWQKAQHLLLEACAELYRRGIPFHLTIVGDGEERGALERARDAMGLSGRVDFTGKMSEARVIEAYRLSDVFALSSVSEGFGMVLLEAMACGIPVVAPALNGIPEIITDGVDGRLFAPGSAANLARVLRELAEDPEQRFRLGGAGRETVLRRFRLDATVAAFHRLLERKS